MTPGAVADWQVGSEAFEPVGRGCTVSPIRYIILLEDSVMFYAYRGSGYYIDFAHIKCQGTLVTHSCAACALKARVPPEVGQC